MDPILDHERLLSYTEVTITDGALGSREGVHIAQKYSQNSAAGTVASDPPWSSAGVLGTDLPDGSQRLLQPIEVSDGLVRVRAATAPLRGSGVIRIQVNTCSAVC